MARNRIEPEGTGVFYLEGKVGLEMFTGPATAVRVIRR
jgi:hypothetical protein